MIEILTPPKLDSFPAMAITEPPVIHLDCGSRIVTVTSGDKTLANCSMTSEPIVYEASDGFRLKIEVTPGANEE